MTQPTEEYEGDIYLTEMNWIGPYLHDEGVIAFDLEAYVVKHMCWARRRMLGGDKDWTYGNPSEYVLPKEFLM